jgi:hypothetical protein
MIGLFKKMDVLISLRHASYKMCIDEYFRFFVAGAFVAGFILAFMAGFSLV